MVGGIQERELSPDAGRGSLVNADIGLRQYRPQEDMKDFVQRVDQQMYQAKNSGKDQMCPDISP